MKKESWIKIFYVTVYAIAMGFLEAAVVIYLRKLFYPEGFNFPLKGFIEPEILNIEWIREFATIVMLLAVGFLAGRKIYEKFAYFLYAFAIWDIFYYLFLKLALDWPMSFLTWDLLFLIPWPWIGPVITPIIYSILFVIVAFSIINFQEQKREVKILLKEWILIITGIILTLYTWLLDYGRIIVGSGFAKDFFTLANNPEFYNIISSYAPEYYNWLIYYIGILLTSIGIAIFYARMKRAKH